MIPALLAPFLAFLQQDVPAPAPPPDRIFVGGRIWTGDDARPRAEAIAVRGNLLVAVGGNDEIRRLAGPRTDAIDLRGRFVAPGFQDAHLHLLSGSLALESVDLSDAWSVEEIQKRIEAFAKAHPDRPWVTGRGWAYGAFPGGLPHRKWLDAVVPDRPAWFGGYDGHTGWCNSKALEAAGVTRATPDPERGEIVRDETGEPTGVLKESAMRLVRRLVPSPTAEEKFEALRKGIDLAASFGLTSVQVASLDPDDLPVYERALREKALNVRVYAAIPMERDPGPSTLARARALREAHRGPLLKLGGVKGYVDGVVESKTAAMLEPYVGGGTGVPNWTSEDLDRAVAAYDGQGFQVWLHAIGDRGIRMALDAFERAAKANGTSGRRHRVEHVEAPAAAEIARFGPLGVVASTQALFANPDRNTLEVYAGALGPERAARAMAFRAIDDAGAVQAFGSDWPVCSMDVRKGIFCAVARTTPEGTPAGGWQPHQRISAAAALRHFTRDAAFASFDEAVTGTLSAGRLADFVVLSEDLVDAPPARILEAKVLLTVMDGRETYRSPDFGSR